MPTRRWFHPIAAEDPDIHYYQVAKLPTFRCTCGNAANTLRGLEAKGLVQISGNYARVYTYSNYRQYSPKIAQFLT